MKDYGRNTFGWKMRIYMWFLLKWELPNHTIKYSVMEYKKKKPKRESLSDLSKEDREKRRKWVSLSAKMFTVSDILILDPEK